jgi:hypothetical protein
MAATSVGPVTWQGDEAGDGCVSGRPTHPQHSDDVQSGQQDHESVGQRPTDSADETIQRGQEAWKRLVRTHNGWDDWVAVGKAHEIGRTDAMRQAHVNEPHGHRYKEAFGAWLKRHGFQNMDKSDRLRLLLVMENLPAIEQWRTTLKPIEQMRLNHPSSVWRRWKASTEAPGKKVDKKPSKLLAALEENVRLKKEIEAGGGDLWNAADTARNAAVIVADRVRSWSRTKRDEFIKELKREFEKQVDRPAPQPKKRGGRQ